ncbi:MAG: hypothetical protein VW405_01265 [Rhodospirillaceae bacterium]
MTKAPPSCPGLSVRSRLADLLILSLAQLRRQQRPRVAVHLRVRGPDGRDAVALEFATSPFVPAFTNLSS